LNNRKYPKSAISSDMAALFASGRKFLVLDTETTGLPHHDNVQIVEVSCVDQDGVVRFTSLVKPDISVPAAATEVHGITDADLINAPTFTQIWPQLLEVLLKYEVVYCYNVDFDYGMLLCTAERFGITIPLHITVNQSWRCAMNIYARWTGTGRWRTLGVACSALGVQMSEAHRSTGDALSTLALMRGLAARAVLESKDKVDG
jgi:DNA polymerase-3 subunit epsilon